MRPTYDELLEIVKLLSAEVKRLQQRIKELEELLNLNSQNSSKSPSTDQKRNKQKPKGHPDHFRKLLSDVDSRARACSLL